jgi:hypothetical protein
MALLMAVKQSISRYLTNKNYENPSPGCQEKLIYLATPQNKNGKLMVAGVMSLD